VQFYNSYVAEEIMSLAGIQTMFTLHKGSIHI